ncbi:hypothetical protein Goari_024185, partial [Gossypium aridum]|nr:hypothetical protein [Gossypium aridum]
MNCRRRPFYTWGVSAINISHKAYIKAQALSEPLGLMAKWLLTISLNMVSCTLLCLQQFWLAIFFFVDDCILALENVVERVFPPSKHVFDKVDEIVQTIETLPGKFDDILDEFPVIIKQVPLLEWGLSLVISWLKLLTSILTRWGSRNTKEKEIAVDTAYEEVINGDVPVAETEHNEAKLPTESPNIRHDDNKKLVVDTTYNEVNVDVSIARTDRNKAKPSTESVNVRHDDNKKLVIGKVYNEVNGGVSIAETKPNEVKLSIKSLDVGHYDKNKLVVDT